MAPKSVDTLYAFGDNITHYKTESAHFWGAYELSNQDTVCFRPAREQNPLEALNTTPSKQERAEPAKLPSYEQTKAAEKKEMFQSSDS